VRARTEPGKIPGMGTGAFPAGFFDRADPGQPGDAGFDATAVEALRDFYDDLGIDGRVLDLCAPSADHFNVPPDELIAGDCSAALPFPDTSFDDALCCEGLASLSQPLDTLAEVARVLRPGGHLVCTFSSRRRPPGAIRGWLAADDAGRVRIARRYFELTPGFGPAESDLRSSLSGEGDRLWAVWATRRGAA
jgi:SAM-dependent methyltransferase